MTVKLCVDRLPMPWTYGYPQMLWIAFLGSNPEIVGHTLDSYIFNLKVS